MTMRTTRLLQLLRNARAANTLIEDLPPSAAPRDLDEAYAVAEELTRGQPIAGWKIGATSKRGQAMLKLKEPFFGRVLAAGVLHSPAELIGDDRGYAVEPEIAFVMDCDLPPRAQPYELEEVRETVRAIAPAFELNRPTYRRPFEVGGFALVADNGVSAGACLGDWRTDWRCLDLGALTVQAVRDADKPIIGSSSAVLGNPLQALTWLANALSRRGARLMAGAIVLSGAMTPPIDLRADQHLRARFTQLGDLQLRATPTRIAAGE